LRSDGFELFVIALQDFSNWRFIITFIIINLDDYIPTHSHAHKLTLFVSGSDEFNQLRPLSYPGTDVFLICYSIFSPESFSNVMKKVRLSLSSYKRRSQISRSFSSEAF
jgi:hypothetical protein